MACTSKTLQKLLLILLFWALPSWVLAVTPPIPAHPAQYVVDLAGVINPGTQASLNALLRDLEAKTTAQVVVLTINSLDGEPIENFSHQTAVKWGIGQKGKDNGVLLTVAVKDRKYRIEVGYGLEGPLPDSLVGSIGRQYLVPNFRKGNFAGGIVAAVGEIAKTISRGAIGSQAGEAAGEQGGAAPQAGSPGTNQNVPGLLFTIVLVIVGLGVFAFVIPRLIKRASGGVWFFGGTGGGWSSGGGDSGGFSGGGGDFGGGGASGDW